MKALVYCQDIVAAGGHIANVGVHGKSVALELEKLWGGNAAKEKALEVIVKTPE